MAYKRSGNQRNSQDGFVLVVTILAVMILMAVGVYALTTSSQDIRAAARSVSEANALSAAEAGAHTLCSSFNPNNLADIPKTFVQNSLNSEKSSYRVVGQNPIGYAICVGCNLSEGGTNMKWDIYEAQVTGFDNMLDGQVSLQVGIVYALPTPLPSGGG
jgi:Tfp pilus assembly protein PilX